LRVSVNVQYTCTWVSA